MPGAQRGFWGYQQSKLADQPKAMMDSIRLKISISQNNEPDLIRYSMFVVSLKDDANDATTFDPATGSLQLEADAHYVYANFGGFTDQTMLNPRMFNIHKTWRFFTGGIVGGQTTQLALKEFSYTVKPRKKMINNPRGSVFGNPSFNFPKDPSQNF
jgi:hypothetical protein